MLNSIKMILVAAAGVYLLLDPIELLNSAIYVLGTVIAIYGLLTCLAYFIQRGKKDQDGQNKRTFFSLLMASMLSGTRPMTTRKRSWQPLMPTIF